jgi:UDP-perosamine 4-acetyltransferase
VVLGGGGHCRSVLDALLSAADAQVAGIVDSDRALWGGSIMGVEVLGGDELLPGMAGQVASHFALGVAGTGGAGLRRRLWDSARRAGLEPLAVVHPQASVSPWARLEAGAQVLRAAVVCAQARVEAGAVVNSGAVVEHGCRVGRLAHVAPAAVLCGGVRVGEAGHVGAGAVVKQGVSLGPGAVVGMGALVLADVPPGVTVAGSPAKPI